MSHNHKGGIAPWEPVRAASHRVQVRLWYDACTMTVSHHPLFVNVVSHGMFHGITPRVHGVTPLETLCVTNWGQFLSC